MAQKVRFLQTSAGEYGLANTGDELVVKNQVATQLEKAGVVEVLGESDEDFSIPEKGFIRIHDETGQSAAPAGETDEKNPTGADKPSPKAAPPRGATKKAAPKKGRR